VASTTAAVQEPQSVPEPPGTGRDGAPASASQTVLETLPRGTQLLYGGNRLVRVPDQIADSFEAGDRLVVVQTTGDVLHIPAALYDLVERGVQRARQAFAELTTLPDAAIARFYDLFAAKLGDPQIWSQIQEANDEDVRVARSRGRSTTRLAADAKMRAKMVEGLHLWRDMPSRREALQETVVHTGWEVQQVVSGLGVVGFVFEGRPNVFADATGVLRSGNTAVMRIGRDALGTAKAIASQALVPALREAGLPEGSIVLVESPEHAAGWALFANPGLALAVARGSGQAVAQLGAIARQTGIPVSLHGTGGAWIVADATADPATVEIAVYHSLDSKKCNTLNTLCVTADAAAGLLPAALAGIERRGRQLGHGFRLHVTDAAYPYLPTELFEQRVNVLRAEGEVEESVADRLAGDQLGVEWEWEGTPEIAVTVVQDIAEAVRLFNEQSPHFVASLVSADQEAHERFFRAVDAPFVGNGFTRWVDGQFALRRPELGLSSWQFGRLFARSGILTGDGVHTIRLRAIQSDPNIHV
jgi:glutamate-5-semialdehyde dehydrogenase